MSAPEADIGHLDVATSNVLVAVATIADAVHAALDVCSAHRTKALAAGFPPQIADAMGWSLWQLMVTRLLQAPGGQS